MTGSTWKVADSGHFGAFAKLSVSHDMLLVCADTMQHAPQFVCLSHQAYLDRLMEVADATGARSITLIPYRSSDRATISKEVLASAIEARRAETGTGSVEDESAVPTADAQPSGQSHD